MNKKTTNGFLPHGMRDGALVRAGSLRAARPDPAFGPWDGVFETVRVANGGPIWLAEHADRLAGAVAWLGRAAGSALGSTRSTLPERCGQVIAANGMSEGSLKVIVGLEDRGWTEVILARATRYGPERYAAGFRLQPVTCGARSAERDGWKTLYRPHHDNARTRAEAAGCDEALWVGPGGRVLEGSVTNIFVVRDGRVSTPPLAAGILPGVVRARVIRLAAAAERDIALDELRNAHEVFVTNALLGLMPVAQIGATPFDLAANPVTRSLMAGLAASLRLPS